MVEVESKYKSFLKEYEELGTLFPSKSFDPKLIETMVDLENDELTEKYSALQWEKIRYHAVRNYPFAISVIKCNNAPIELKEELIDFIPRDALSCVLRHENLSRKCYEKAMEIIGCSQLLYFLDVEQDYVSERAKRCVANFPDTKQKEIEYYGYKYMKYENPNHKKRIDDAIANPDTEEDILMAIADNTNLPEEIRNAAYDNVCIVDDFYKPTSKMQEQIYQMLVELIFDFSGDASDKDVRDEAQGRLYYGFSHKNFSPACERDYVERFIHDPFAMGDECMQILADKSTTIDVLKRVADYDGKLASIMEMREDINQDIYDVVESKLRDPEEKKKWLIKSVMKCHIPPEKVLNVYNEIQHQEIILAYIASVQTPVKDGYIALLKTGMQEKAKALQYFKREIDGIENNDIKQALLSTMLRCITERDWQTKKYLEARYRNNYRLTNIFKKDATIAKEAVSNIQRLYPDFNMDMNAFIDKIDDALLNSTMCNAVPKIYNLVNFYTSKDTMFYLIPEAMMQLDKEDIDVLKKAIESADKETAINFRDAMFGVLDRFRHEDMDEIQKFIYKYADVYEAIIQKIKEKEVHRDDTER